MSQNSNKLQLILIITIPIVGLLAMTAYYFYVTSQGLHTDTHNHGVLVNPPKQIGNIALAKTDNTLYKVADGDDHWTFMYVSDGECDKDCVDTLYLMRQIKAALGKYGPRVDNLYVSLKPSISEVDQALLSTEYQEHAVVFTDENKARAWFSKKAPALEITNTGRFYLIDPRGWVMMYFTDENNYKEIIKDMKFLMKNS